MNLATEAADSAEDRPAGLTSSGLSIGQCATLACLLECTAPKPGNVHRGADFADTRFEHFLASAASIGPAMEMSRQTPLGRTVLEAVEQSRRIAGENTNLGIVLLLAPLAGVPASTPLQLGVERVLQQLKPEDSADIYRAIRLAAPGGLGSVSEMDVQDQPPGNLLLAMRAAEDRDMVARQYARNFEDLFESIVPWLEQSLQAGPLLTAIVHVHLLTMHKFPDSLIARKAGRDLAGEIAARAGRVLESGTPDSEPYRRGLSDLDFYLRSDGNVRNPGTTADLVAAALFVALRDGLIPLPLQF